MTRSACLRNKLKYEKFFKLLIEFYKIIKSMGISEKIRTNQVVLSEKGVVKMVSKNFFDAILKTWRNNYALVDDRDALEKRLYAHRAGTLFVFSLLRFNLTENPLIMSTQNKVVPYVTSSKRHLMRNYSVVFDLFTSRRVGRVSRTFALLVTFLCRS